MARGRIVGLDVLRGVAILLVMLRHAWPEVFGGGGITGVTLFFALSGYLITGVLLRSRDEAGRMALRSFYLRRVARLYPALVLMLAVLTVVELP